MHIYQIHYYLGQRNIDKKKHIQSILIDADNEQLAREKLELAIPLSNSRRMPYLITTVNKLA